MVLGELMGKMLDAGADYRSFWSSLKDSGGLGKVSEADRERVTTGDYGEESGGTAVRLFGSEIACHRIVFVLDVSGSMLTIDPGDGEGDADMGSTTGEEEKGKPDRRYRIERAKRELKRVIKALPESTQINIVAYSSVARIWKPKGLHKLTAKAKTEAVSFVDGFRAEGVTATDEALRRAFRVEGARCFYLLSDGKPSLGEGNDIPPSQIYSLVEEENKLLKIRIYTLGFRGADQSFMQELAKRTGGTYRDIR